MSSIQNAENIIDRYQKQQLQETRVAVVVPAYNESGNIKKVVNEIKALPFNITVVVVNDCSTDDTYVQAEKENVTVLNLPFNLGIGGAVQTGIQFAQDNDFDIAVQVDGDGQHDVAFLKNLIEPIINNEYDFVIGSRFIPPYLGYQSSFVRRIGINFFAVLLSLITDYKITDPTSGFRAMNKNVIKLFAENYPTDYPEPEAIVLAGQHKIRLLEVPVQMRKRNAGASSIRYLKTLYYMIKVTLAVLIARIK